MANKTITLTLKLDGTGKVITGVDSVGDVIVRLGDTAQKEGPRFGRIMESALGFVAANAVTALTSKLAQIPGLILEGGKALESQLSDLSAITGIMGDDLKELGDTAVSESIRTGVAAVDQVEAYKLLASNIDITTIGGVAGLKLLGEQVVTLSLAAKTDLATAAEAVAGSINQFGLSAEESARVVNALAAGAKFGAAEIPDLAASIKEAGTASADANIEFEVTVGALEVMSQRMLKGSQAGTNFRNVVTILRTSMKELAALGIKDVNLENDGLVATLKKLQPLLGDAAGMVKIFGRENITAASMLIKNADAVQEMTDRVTDTNTAQEQAAIQTDNLAGSTAKLMELVKAIALGGYALISDELKEVIDSTITAAMWMKNHTGEMVTAAKIIAVLSVATGSYIAILKTESIIVSLIALRIRAAAFAKQLYAVVTQRATIAQLGFNTAIKSNPIGLLLSVLATAATAYFMFRNRTSEATQEIKNQRTQIQGLTGDIKELASSQLFQRYAELKDQQAQINDQLDETAQKLERNAELPFRTNTVIGWQNDLLEQQNELQEQLHSVTTAISQAVMQGASNLEARRAVLAKEVKELEAQGSITDELVQKRSELKMIESQILEIKKESVATDGDDQVVIENALTRRELELRLMEEGLEKRLETISLEVDQEIQKYREEYAEQYPLLFAELEEQLRSGKEQLIKDLQNVNNSDHAVPVPIKLEAEFELPEGELDLGAALKDGLVALDGALSSVNHNLSVLRQRYAEAQSAGERWDIYQKILELEALDSAGRMMIDTMETIKTGGIEAFTALGESIGASIAGIEGSMDDMAKAMKLILADIARSIGKMLLKQAAALAAAGLWGRAARLAAAGTGLIILASAIANSIKRQESQDAERERLQGDRQPRSFSRGGLVTGPGTGTSDSIPARLSNGEYVVNAASATRNYPLLSMINEGGILQMAGASSIDADKLEAAVSKAVVSAIGSIEFKAEGATLRAVDHATGRIEAIAALE